MSAKKKYLIGLVVVLLLLIPGVTWFNLQFGLDNRGQEFGTYGQYNRVLRLVREMEGYVIVNSRLSRRLDWRNLGHLDSFSVKIRDSKGRTGSIEFLRGSKEMEERDPVVLKEIIKAKFDRG